MVMVQQAEVDAAAGRRKRPLGNTPTVLRVLLICSVLGWWASVNALVCLTMVPVIRAGTALRSLPFVIPVLLVFQVAAMLVYMVVRLNLGGTISGFEKMMFRAILPEN